MSYDDFLPTLENRIKKGFEWFESHLSLTLISFFLLSLIIRLVVTPFDSVLREDGYIYLMKSLEITKGNFLPPLSHSTGWPLFMAPFLKLFKIATLYKEMKYARLLSVLIGSLLIFPVYKIGTRILEREEIVFLVVLFTFSSQLIISATSAMTEPLFMLLLFTSLYFLYRAIENKHYLLWSSFVAGLAYYVRSNGIFLLLIILVAQLSLWEGKEKFRYALYAIVVFFVISAPWLIQRYLLFGSPTNFGPNSKFFVDNYQEVWCSNISAPSLIVYLKTHTFLQWINRFVIHGILELVFLDFIYKTLSAILCFPFLYAILRYAGKRQFLPLNITIIVWFVGLTPVWKLFSNPRHLYPLIPAVLIFTSAAICDMFGEHKYRNLLKFLFLVVFISFSLVNPIKEKVSPEESYVTDGLKWSKWVAENVTGKIAVVEGGDLIMMHLPDTVVGGVGEFNLYAPKSGVSIERPGCFDTLESAMRWFKKEGISYIIADNLFSFKRPYLEKLFWEKEPPLYLKLIYSNVESSSKWKVKVFSIEWNKFDKQVQ